MKSFMINIRLFKYLKIIILFFLVVWCGVFIFLSTYDFNQFKPMIEQGVLQSTGRKLTVHGDINFHMGLSPGVLISDISFENAPWSHRPDMLHIDQLKLNIAIWPLIHKKVIIKSLVLNNCDLSIETNKDGLSNLSFKPQPSHEESTTQSDDNNSDPKISFQSIQCQSIQLTYSDERNQPPKKITFHHISFQTKGIDHPITVDLSGKLPPHSFSTQATLGSIQTFLDPQQKWTIDLKTIISGMNFTIYGDIQDISAQKGIQITCSSQGKNLDALQTIIGHDLPFNGPYQMEMIISEQSVHIYKTALSFILGTNKLKGIGSLDFTQLRPKFKIVLDADTIDLRPFHTKKNSTKAKNHDIQPTSRIFPTQPLQLDPLLRADIAAIIRIQKLITKQIAIHQFDTQIQVNQNGIRINPLTAKIGGGNVSANLNLDIQQSQVNGKTDLAITDMNLGQMLKELDISETIEDCPFDMNLQLQSQGQSISQLMANLNGYFTLLMDKGKLYNQYVNFLGGELSSTLLRFMNPLQNNKYAIMNCLAARFDIQNGLSESKIIMLDTDQMRVIGSGKIDFGEETLNISIKPLPKSGLDTGRLGKFSLSLSELASPFKLGGTFAHPSLKIDIKQAAWTIGKAVGGIMLFGPAGIAAALISNTADNENPCELAKHVVMTGNYPQKQHDQHQHPDQPDESLLHNTQQTIKNGMNRVGESIGNTWKKLIGK